MRRILFSLMVLAGIALLSGCEVPTEFFVNSTVDSVDAVPGDGVCETATEDECTLRAAVQEANAMATPVTVHLTGGRTYRLYGSDATDDDAGAVGDLDVTGQVTIEGHGAVIDTLGSIRLVDNVGTVALHALTLRGGAFGDFGNLSPSLLRNQGGASIKSSIFTNAFSSNGAIHQVSGGLMVQRSHIFNATVGLVVNGGQATVIDTSIHDIGCYHFCGELPAVGQTGGELTVINSTLSATNRTITYPCPSLFCTAFITGYGLQQYGGSATLVRSTVVSNRHGLDGDNITLLGTVVAGNNDTDCTGAVTSLGYNLDEDSTCITTPTTGDRPGSPSGLPSLATGRSHVIPTVGSALLDQVPVGTPYLCDGQHPVDQRGLPRPAGTACDIGAIERQPTDP